MRWTERQRAMLEEMGLRVFEQQPAGPAVAEAEPEPEPAMPHVAVRAPAVAAPAPGKATVDWSALPGVAARSDDGAHWMIVGDPFAGPSLQLLDEMLRALGMVRCEPAPAKPDAVLAMGRSAVQALLRSDEPVGKLRGRVHGCDGVPLVVSFHTDYLLRNPAEKARAWDDLCLAAEAAAKSSS